MKNPYFKRLTRRWRAQRAWKILGDHGIGILSESKNGVLAVQPGDFNVSRALIAHGEYDWPQISWLVPIIGANARIVFAGAHLGAVLVPIVRLVVPRSVIAYEPSPRNFRLLNLNLLMNRLDQVIAWPIALGEKPGSVRFTENRINTGNSRVAAGSGEIQVDRDTLDRTLPPEWDSVDLIIMDVEGSEVFAMRGAAATLAKTQHLYVEYAPDQLREQGSSAEEFVTTAAQFFQSAYVFGERVTFLGPDRFARELIARQHERGLLLNVLFSHDLAPDPKLLENPKILKS